MGQLNYEGIRDFGLRLFGNLGVGYKCRRGSEHSNGGPLDSTRAHTDRKHIDG
jgi:hypothetical protein